MLEAAAGEGVVFRALDRVSGLPAALKLPARGEAVQLARFEREARLLAAIEHPAIVRYLDHGRTSEGDAYLAMEWLEGHDLSQRLAQQRLTVDEALVLGARVAEALGVLHARGLVHRDVKPSNIFLVGASVAEAKLLDFGIARQDDITRLTLTGTVIGTVGYLAPEQACGEGDVDARADVYALGCVLFECLSGEPVFGGDNAMAILAKILFEAAPRLSELRAEVPAGLDALIGRMLRKDAGERPRDGRAVAEALAAMNAGGVTAEAVPTPALTVAERRLLPVLLVRGARDAVSTESTSPSWARAAQEVVEAQGARVERLADGTIALLIEQSGSQVATDQAAHAARCALALREELPHAAMALSMGRSTPTGRSQVSDAIDRAAQLLSTARLGPGAPAIWLDDVTAGLLGAGFEVAERDGGRALLGTSIRRTRRLLGKPSPFVGRERELRLLEDLFAESIDEPLARAVVVTAPAGMGKSRLAHELARRVQERSRPVTIWQGQGDVLRAGSAFGVIDSVLRGVFGTLEGEPLEARRAKVRARVNRHVPAADQERLAELLGEIVAVPFPEENSPLLRAARQNPQLMGEQIGRAWEQFARAEVSAQPVLIVLDDLHWGDAPSVRLLDGALRALSELPWMIIALGRPELDDLFPQLWRERRMQRLQLESLTRKASERLVRQILGDAVGAETIERVVAQADGHVFYLEELIRAVAEGKDESLPETVLAMVEVRLAGLSPSARRVLRAASVYGDVFWASAVGALLPGVMTEAALSVELDGLVEREFLVSRPESRLAGEREYAFRHALLREGAYAMLAEEDRALGHRLAGAWLESRSERDPIVLAEHFERGGARSRAAGYHLQAAEQAFRGADLRGLGTYVGRGLACEPEGPARVGLLELSALVSTWSREYVRASVVGAELLRIAPPGSAPWLTQAAIQYLVSPRAGRDSELLSMMREGMEREPSPRALNQVLHALSLMVASFRLGARPDLADEAYARMRALTAHVALSDPFAEIWVSSAGMYDVFCGSADPWSVLTSARAALAFSITVNTWGTVIATYNLEYCLWYIGSFAEARQSLEKQPSVPAAWNTSLRELCAAFVLADSGAVDLAVQRAQAVVARAQEERFLMDEARGRNALAYALLRHGELPGAEREARASLSLFARPFAAPGELDDSLVELRLVAPVHGMAVRALLAAILLAEGRAADALAESTAAMAEYEALGARGGFGFQGAFARLTHAEALLANGDRAGARALVEATKAHLLRWAAAIEDPALRRGFLEDVPENARILALSRQWSEDDAHGG